MRWISEREMAVRTVLVESKELVFVRHALEASEGLGFIVSEKGGDLVIAALRSQEAELDAFLRDMAVDTGLVVVHSTKASASPRDSVGG